MLISLHLPKTGGTSFMSSLEEHYSNNILRDYADLPLNTPAFKRNMHALKMCILNGIKPPGNVECIHGHFLPLKYLFCREARFITWMRDPVERLGSHYSYWIRNYNPDTAPVLHKRVIEEEWSLERFCLSRELRNFYSQYLWGFPIKRFYFIGITEYFDTEMEYLSNRLFGNSLPYHRKNTNEFKEDLSYFKDENFRKRVENYHDNDVSLYKQALDMRLTRRSAGHET